MSTFKYYKNGQWNTVTGAVAGDTLPIGAITEFGGSSAPANWLICDGRAISRTGYADLFEVLGTSFGSGDGSTTFNLPDLRGRVAVGKNTGTFNSLGATGGEETHTLTTQEMPSHNHTYDVRPKTDAWVEPNFVVNYQYASSSPITGYTNSRGDGQSHNNLQPYQVVNYIIKAFQSSGVVANVANSETSSSTDTYSCDYINNNFSLSMAKIGLTENFPIQLSQYANINKLTITYQKGDKFSISGGLIKIGAGVHHVKLYAQLGINSTGGHLIYMYSTVNGTNTGLWTVKNMSGSYDQLISTEVLSVKENDLVSASIYYDYAGSVEKAKTSFIIEVLD